ncbi:hypothetical protein [Limnohabitans sp. DM1]|uniref:hypothetical protein n=1 Tax=Limnohabitans sp. DM1 TaxID=1597955 RepID=UPI000B1C6BBC|nr:hypothetical protein [Limnohabitans sp. DM1]
MLLVFPLVTDVAQPAAFMRVCHSADEHRTAVQQAVVDLVVAEGFESEQVETVERNAFYEKMKGPA